MLSLPLDEVSAKLRTGPPRDDPEDLELACWAGEVPLVTLPLAPVEAPDLASGLDAPALARFERGRRRA